MCGPVSRSGEGVPAHSPPLIVKRPASRPSGQRPEDLARRDEIVFSERGKNIYNREIVLIREH